MGHRSVTTEQAGKQMPMPVRYNTEKGAGRRCCRKHTGVPRSSASLHENLHRKSYGASKEKQREKRPESVRQHFVLSARDPFFFLVLLLLWAKKVPFGIKFLPTISNYLDLPMYLILPLCTSWSVRA